MPPIFRKLEDACVKTEARAAGREAPQRSSGEGVPAEEPDRGSWVLTRRLADGRLRRAPDQGKTIHADAVGADTAGAVVAIFASSAVTAWVAGATAVDVGLIAVLDVIFTGY